MAASTTSIDRHPDIVAMRMKYEQASETSAAHIVNGLALLAGLFLAISPWVVGFQALAPLAVTNLLTGLVLVAIAFGLATAFGRLHGLAWVVPVVGAWTAITPWVVRGGVDTDPAIVTNVTVGVICFLLGAATLLVGRRR